jgi:uncharacterized protein YndB with AHSA1/START domain
MPVRARSRLSVRSICRLSVRSGCWVLVRSGWRSVRRVAAVAILVVLGAAPAAAQDVTPVITEGFVGAPLRAVWDAWTTLEGLRGWLTPKAEIDLRVGGLIRTNYRENEVLGDPGTIVYTITEIEPQRRLSFQITTPPQNFPFKSAVRQMTTTIYVAAVDERTTALRIVDSGFGVDQESQQMRVFFREGDAITLQRLQFHFRAVR